MRMTCVKAGLAATCLMAALGVTGNVAFAEVDDDGSFTISSRTDDDADGGARVIRVRPDSDDVSNSNATTNQTASTTSGNASSTTSATTASSTPSTNSSTGSTASGMTTPSAVSAQAGGNATGNAAPVGTVPEPETYAMMALGLVLMGYVARRRKA